MSSRLLWLIMLVGSCFASTFAYGIESCSDLLNVAVVGLIADCIKMRSPGLWMSVRVGDQCHFSVRAGYSPSKLREPEYPATLTATNAQCKPLPKSGLPPNGVVADCVRKG